MSQAVLSRRQGLIFSNEDAVIADIRSLRRGYSKTGAWSLAQVCWHLDATSKGRMAPGPFPDDTPEQQSKKDLLKQILVTSQLPTVTAPERVIPPADAPDSAIDALIDTLTQLKAFAGPMAPHRIFGRMSDADARRLNLIHCAHHLSFLVPSH
jgi:hypothetical protein